MAPLPCEDTGPLRVLHGQDHGSPVIVPRGRSSRSTRSAPVVVRTTSYRLHPIAPVRPIDFIPSRANSIPKRFDASRLAPMPDRADICDTIAPSELSLTLT